MSDLPIQKFSTDQFEIVENTIDLLLAGDIAAVPAGSGPITEKLQRQAEMRLVRTEGAADVMEHIADHVGLVNGSIHEITSILSQQSEASE